jgi:hypothetical protein
MELKLIGVVATLACAAFLGTASLPTSDQPKAAQPLPYLVAWSGIETKAPSKLERITTREAWERVWTQHTGTAVQADAWPRPSIPEVDFARCMVISIVPGEEINAYSVQLVEVQDRKADTLLRYDVLRYQVSSPLNADKPAPVQKNRPYGFFVIERTLKPLVLENNVQNIIGQPPIWKEAHRLDAVE